MSIRLERRWPLWCVLAVAVAWLAAAATAAAPGIAPPVRDAAGIVAAILPPLGLMLLVACLLPGTGRTVELAEVEGRLTTALAQVGALQDQLSQVDYVLARSADSTTRLMTVAADQLPGLGGSAAALEAAATRVVGAGDDVQRIVDGFRAALPSLEATMQMVDATLRNVSSDSAVQLRAVETMMAQVQARNRQAAIDADAAIAAMTALLATIDEASVRNTTALSKRAYALDAAVDGVLERTTAAVDGIRERVNTQLVATQAAIEASSEELVAFGDVGARAFEARIAALLGTSETLRGQFEAQETGVDRLQALIADHLADLHGRFAGMETQATATFAAIAGQLTAIAVHLAGLEPPLTTAREAVGNLAVESDALGSRVAGIDAEMNRRLGDTRTAMGTLEGEAQRVLARVETLNDSVAGGAVLVGDAAAMLAREREAVTAAAAELAGQFDAAEAALGSIEAGMIAAAEAVSVTLGSEVARVGGAGTAAAATLRDQLTIVIAEAVVALERAASVEAEAAFGAPVRLQIAAVEAATTRASSIAQATAERLAAQMLTLVATVDSVEARVGEVETGFAVRARDTLAARSMRVIEALNRDSVDVAALLTITVGEGEWAAYLGGDRGVFARVVAPLLNRDRSRQIARLWKQDPDFRDIATRFCTQFEELLQRLLGDRDGEALAATILSSDLGKIYVALVDGQERQPLQG